MPRMDDIDLDIKIKELEESVKCRRERRKEQKKEMEQELEKSMKKESSRSQDRIHTGESEKKTAGSSLTVNLGKYNSSPSNGGHLVSDQEEKYIKELCETEKRIRQLESTISDLNFELEKIDLAETTGVSVKSLEMEVGLGHGDVSSGRVSTDI